MKSSHMCIGFVVGVCILNMAVSFAGTAGEVDHSGYDAFLKEYTRDGLVDYGAVKDNMKVLEDYLGTLGDSSAVYYDAWSREARMAFWINAYNAVTIYAVAKTYPIEPDSLGLDKRFPANSIMQIDGFLDTAYVHLAGRPVSLNMIRHEILRGEFADPRIHFALVTASIGSPLLSDDAYLAATLDEQLEGDAVRFAEDYDRVRVNITQGKLYVSEIFDWYAGDFETDTGGVPGWLQNYKKNTRGYIKFIATKTDEPTRVAMETRELRVKHIKFDWSLNEVVEGD